MTDTEKRRLELLTQTRKLYHDTGKVPAVHPRYGNAYRTLYENNNFNENSNKNKSSSINLRLFLALLIFVLYAGANYQGITIGGIDSSEIVEVISQDIQMLER